MLSFFRYFEFGLWYLSKLELWIVLEHVLRAPVSYAKCTYFFFSYCYLCIFVDKTLFSTNVSKLSRVVEKVNIKEDETIYNVTFTKKVPQVVTYHIKILQKKHSPLELRKTINNFFLSRSVGDLYRIVRKYDEK